MIIVEGPDGAGKSTLVKQILDDFGLDVVEGQRPGPRAKLYEETVKWTFRALREEVYSRGPSYVWDRMYFSELVYYPLTGGECRFNGVQQTFINRVLSAIECPIIWCMPPFPVVQENVGKVEQMEGVIDKTTMIYTKYDALLTEGILDGMNIILYDYTQENTEPYNRVKGTVQAYLNKREVREW